MQIEPNSYAAKVDEIERLSREVYTLQQELRKRENDIDNTLYLLTRTLPTLSAMTEERHGFLRYILGRWINRSEPLRNTAKDLLDDILPLVQLPVNVCLFGDMAMRGTCLCRFVGDTRKAKIVRTP